VGFGLLGCANTNLDRDFAQSPLSRFARPEASANVDIRDGSALPAPQSIDRSLFRSAGFRYDPTRGDTALIGFLHPSVPEHSDRSPSGLCVHLRSQPHVTAGCRPS
jgi:hypothetical protein